VGLPKPSQWVLSFSSLSDRQLSQTFKKYSVNFISQ